MAKVPEKSALRKLAGRFREPAFLKKVARYAARAGRKLIELAWKLYLVWKDPRTPRKAILVIAGALAYFVLPFDLVPDFLPVVGFTDDFGVIVTAAKTVETWITSEHGELAREKVLELFGDDGDA